REGRPLLLIDISVPRSVEAGVNDLEMVYTYNVDSLRELADKAQDKRLAASREAEHLLGRWSKEILDWLSSGQSASLITALNDKAEGLRREEVNKALKKMEHLRCGDREKIDYMTKALVKKILH